MRVLILILLILIAIAVIISSWPTMARVMGANEAILGGANKAVLGARSRGRKNIEKDLTTHPRTKSEQYVIDIFEKQTGEQFPTMLPKWLVYNGRQLELDGYCEKLGIAVEFSGPLHTKWYPNKESYEKYLNRIKRDEAKIKICRENNVRLFVIDMRIPKHQLNTYVKSRLYDAGLVPRPANYLPEEIYAPDVDYSKYAKTQTPHKIENENN